MSDANNPYLPPSLAAAEERRPARLPSQEALARFRYFNTVVSFCLMIPGFYCSLVDVLRLIAVAAYLGFQDRESEFYAGCLLLPCLLSIGVLGIYQRRLNVVAVTLSFVLAVAALVGLLAFGSYFVLQVSRPGSTDLDPLFVLLFVPCGCVLLSTPIYVASRFWTWHRQGIDLREIRKEICRRG